MEHSRGVYGIVVFLAFVCGLAGGVANAQGSSPYCAVPVFEVPYHPLGGQATFDMMGRPVILVDPTIVARLPFPHGGNFMQFLLAHECVHHVENHIYNLMQAGVFGGYALMQMSHRIELEADCKAAQILTTRGLHHVIESAVWVFANSNPFPSHSHPGGQARAQNIVRCAR